MIRCWLLTNYVASRAETGSTLPPWVSNHVKECADCGRRLRSAMQVAEQLRSSAEMHRAVLPPFLHGKIMKALATDTRLEQPSRRINRWAWAAIPALIGLFLMGVQWLDTPPTPSQKNRPSTTIASDAVSRIASADRVAARKLSQWQGLLENPLETELRLVWSDARSVARSLARDFLPSDGILARE